MYKTVYIKCFQGVDFGDQRSDYHEEHRSKVALPRNNYNIPSIVAISFTVLLRILYERFIVENSRLVL